MMRKDYRTMACKMFYLSSLVILAALQGIHAVEYNVTNKAGNGSKYSNEIGDEYSKQTLMCTTSFIWRLFQQNTEADRKDVQSVILFIEPIDGPYPPYAYQRDNEIHVNANHLQNFSGDVKREFTGILYHEMTHIWQWDGNGQRDINEGLMEGIADYVRLKADYAPTRWVQPGQGDKWDEGYDVTALFLDYCGSLRNGFVAELNKKMRTVYSENYFVELLGKTVDQLWRDYKAKYKN